ncbi:YheC/YheD family protein [Mesobacillus zeae]|uniref:YheC/YheD family protein n=1 Tax=Mesobacillus zeae TaxID=1917180 RepID=A0A398B473_9BACI|nr:YheC/YheD family protein [Mesobacillus zeae]RID84642.1 YheC/YheD family protein [Mesobacillus zeae]
MKKRYQIEVNINAKLKVFCPRILLREKQVTRIAFGNKMADVDIQAYDGNRIMIPACICDMLHFPDNASNLYALIDDHTLFIGPLIGILTSGFTPFATRPVGERSSFFYRLLSSSKEAGAFTYVFGKEHIDWDKGIIRGYTVIDSEWIKMEVPFPNVIYDRLPNRRAELDHANREVKQRFESDYLVPFYNPGFFSKLDVFERLQQDESVSSHLPETHPFSSFSVIERMLAVYGHVYVKPINGSLGNGVHQIIYSKREGFYFCRYRDREGHNKLLKFDSLEGLMEKIFEKRNLSSMIVQQGIRMLRLDSRLVDFRVHTNKDGDGRWQIAAIAAKIGGTGSATTHVNNGGEVKTLTELFEAPEDRLRYEQLLSAAALNLSNSLEEQMTGFIGEIGFDFGIDREDKVWLFEANSKPGRSIFKHPELKEFDILTRKLSLAYGVYLAEKAILHPEELFT